MVKFNTKTRGVYKTRNKEGAPAYKLDPKMELYSAAVTSLLSDKFYEGASERLDRIVALIKKADPEFVAKLAVYAREKMHLRSLPLVIAVELAKVHNGDDLLRRLVGRIVQRADEITEVLAYYDLANKRTGTKKLNKISNQVIKGLKDAFNKFDEYQFAKYNRDGAVKLRDALFIVHPHAKDRNQQDLFDKIVKSELATPYTWEVELSKKGADKKKVWEELVDSGKLGYMAMLRNLRNMLEADISVKHLQTVAGKLSDKEEVLKSKQFPFRFMSAYREIKDVTSGHSSMILDALEEAMLASAENIKGFDYNTAVMIACDVSGSMQTPISDKSKVQNYDIGLTLGMLLQSRCKNVQTGMFGETWKIINLPKKSILANVEEFHNREGEVGYATNGYLVLQDLIDRKNVVDKIMMFTDNQMWDSYGVGATIQKSWAEYKKIAPNAKMYLFDLAGHGNTPVNIQGGDVYLIAGWSDKVFEMLAAYEKGESAVAEIEKIVL